MTQPASAPSAQSSGAPQTELARDLRLFDITMVGVGAMIGAGIFALTGIAAGKAGPGLLLAFALNGLLTLCTAMVYAEVGSAIPGAGGGYLWVKFGLPGPSAFLAGWMDWLAHAVAGSLYAAVFGSYCVWGLQTIFGWGTVGANEHDYGTLFGGIPAIWFAKALTAAVCLYFIRVNYRGSSETGKTGNIITVAKIIIIAIFILFGLVAMLQGGAAGPELSSVSLGEKFSNFLPKGMTGVLVAMGLTFIAFEGYEIIVQAGEEVVEPRKNIPRAVFYSLLIVIPIYLLVAIVCLGAVAIPLDRLTEVMTPSDTWLYLSSLGERGVAEAANQFMPWLGLGAILLVFGAILSTMSALNATTYSSTRVSFAMGRDRYLPAIMSRISPRTRTPVAALFASGALITVTAIALPVDKIAAATCVMFLLVFIQVNASAIFIRRKYADHLQYGYVMPWYPVIPIVAIIGQAGVAIFLFIQEPLALWVTAAWVGVGFVIYYTYSKRQESESKASPVVLEQTTAVAETKYRILVPVANPANAEPLIELAARLASRVDSTLVVLHVVSIPEQLPYSAAGQFVQAGRIVLDEALNIVNQKGAKSVGLIRVGRNPGRSIVDTLQERKAHTLVMGWSGPRVRGRDYRQPGSLGLSRKRPLIGAEIDHVITRADANTVVLRGRLPDSPKRILIPIANPKQGEYAIAVAEAVAADDCAIDLIHVTSARETVEEAGVRLMRELFDTEALEAASPQRQLPVSLSVVASTNVLQSIFQATVEHDLVVIGAAADSWWQRRAFTHFHYDLASRYPGPLLLVKVRSGRARFASQQMFEFFRSTEPEP